MDYKNAQIPEWSNGIVCKTIDSLVRIQLCAQKTYCNLAQWQSIPFIWEWSMVRIHQLQQSYDTIEASVNLDNMPTKDSSILPINDQSKRQVWGK